MTDNGAPTMSPVAELPPVDALQVAPVAPPFTGSSGPAGAEGAPELVPPTAQRAETGEAVTAGWHSGKAVTRLFHNTPANAWIALAGVGWKRLNPAHESGAAAMVAIAAHAVDNGLAVNAYEGSDGYIHQLYCW